MGRGGATEEIFGGAGVVRPRSRLGAIGERFQELSDEQLMERIYAVPQHRLYERIPEPVKEALGRKIAADIASFRGDNDFFVKLRESYGELDVTVEGSDAQQSAVGVRYRLHPAGEPERTLFSGRRPFPWGECLRMIKNELTHEQRAATLELIG
jgi:hypothetical protein